MSDHNSSRSSVLESLATREVLFLLLPGVHVLDLAGAMQVFWEADSLGGRYRVRSVGVADRVETAQGLTVADLDVLPDVKPGSLVLVPGTESSELDSLRDVVPGAWLRRALDRGAEVGSICSGAFVLAWAGLLDGRRCTTHWKLVDRLRAEVPNAHVSADRLFERDRGVVTSAGEASGIDLALSLVEEAHGPITAAKVAREMVVYLRRDGKTAQHSIFLDHRTHLHPGVHRVQDWLVSHPSENPSLDALARIAGMSPRNLTRRFRELTGITLKAFVHRLKLEIAENLLHDPTLTVEAVATRCGFEDARQLRRLWRRHHGASPAAWRDRRLDSHHHPLRT